MVRYRWWDHRLSSRSMASGSWTCAWSFLQGSFWDRSWTNPSMQALRPSRVRDWYSGHRVRWRKPYQTCWINQSWNYNMEYNRSNLVRRFVMLLVELEPQRAHLSDACPLANRAQISHYTKTFDCHVAHNLNLKYRYWLRFRWYPLSMALLHRHSDWVHHYLPS